MRQLFKKYCMPIIIFSYLTLIVLVLPILYVKKIIKKQKTKPPFNILYIIATLNVGGAEVQLKNLLKYLNKEKYNPSLCVLVETGPLEKEIKELGVPIIILRKKSKFNFTIVFDLLKIIKTRQIDLTHNTLFTSNFWGRIAGTLAGTKIVASERSAYKKPNLIIYDRVLSHFTDKIICNSKAVKEYQTKIEKINPKILEVIYNGVDLEKFDRNFAKAKENRVAYKNQLGIKEKEFVIGNVCRITPEKDLLTWLKTAKILLEKNKQLKFIIVGDAISAIKDETGYKKEISDLIKKLNMGENVIMTGFSSDTAKELAIMDLFYQSSVIEGFPNAVLEAMAAGLPVVATPAGGTREVLINEENGIITDSEPENTARKISELLNNPEKAKIFGQNARLTIKNNFSGEKLARNTEKLYNQIILN